MDIIDEQIIMDVKNIIHNMFTANVFYQMNEIMTETQTIVGWFDYKSHAIDNITKLEYKIKENKHAQDYIEGMVSKDDCMKGWRKINEDVLRFTNAKCNLFV